MSIDPGRVIEAEFDQEEYERLSAVTDTPDKMLRVVAMERIELEESIVFTREGGFDGPKGFPKMADDSYPTWPLGSVLGIELESMGAGESHWCMGVEAKHANPMGTVHGGVLCDIGAAALSTADTSTLDEGQLFTTVDLRINFLRPVRTGRLEAFGRVVQRGRTIGLAESEVTHEDGDLVAKLSGTCMTLDE